MTAADKFGIAFSIGFTIALIGIAMSFASMSQSPAPAAPAPAPAPAPTPAPTTPPPMEEKPMEEKPMEEKPMEEERMMEEEEHMEHEEEGAPMTVTVSVPQDSQFVGCEETDECFIPYEVTVAVGGTVTWTNDDTAAHTVTSGTVTDGPDGIFDSSILMVAKTFEHTFDEAGTYDYFCIVHPWMTGIVNVE